VCPTRVSLHAQERLRQRASAGPPATELAASAPGVSGAGPPEEYEGLGAGLGPRAGSVRAMDVEVKVPHALILLTQALGPGLVKQQAAHASPNPDPANGQPNGRPAAGPPV